MKKSLFYILSLFVCLFGLSALINYGVAAMVYSDGSEIRGDSVGKKAVYESYTDNDESYYLPINARIDNRDNPVGRHNGVFSPLYFN